MFKDLSTTTLFKKKNTKKTLTTILSEIHGLNTKSICKIILLNGLLNSKNQNIQVKNFNNIISQTRFFYNVEKNKIFYNVKKKMKIKNYSGMRHILKLPVRGQRTHTNSSSARKNIKKEVL